MTICAIIVRCKDRERFQHHLDICQDSQQNGLTHGAVIQARIGVKNNLGRVVVLTRAGLGKGRNIMLRSMLLGTMPDTMLGVMRTATIGALVNMLKVGMYIGLVMISALTSQCCHITAHQDSDIEHEHQEC
jgi:hypothetical protein